MSRSRVFFPMLGVYVSTGATTTNFSSGNSGVNSIKQLERIQTFNFNFTNNRTDVNEFGQIDTLTRVITSPANVTADTSYIVADLANESALGLYVSGDQSCIKDLLNNTDDEHNLYLAQAPEGQDLIGFTGQSQTTQLTNMVLASWTTQGQIGAVPTTNVSLQGMNVAYDTGSKNQFSKAIDRSSSTEVSNILYTLPTYTTGIVGAVAALRPCDIELSLGSPTIGYLSTDLHPQSYNLSFSLNRTSLSEFGKFFPYLIAIQPPVNMTASFDFNYGDLATGDLAGLQCNDTVYNFTLNLRDPSCPPLTGPIAAQYRVVGAKLDSQNVTNNIGNAASTLTASFSLQLGQTASTNGFFISGKV